MQFSFGSCHWEKSLCPVTLVGVRLRTKRESWKEGLQRGGCKEDEAEDTDGRRLEGVVHPE